MCDAGDCQPLETTTSDVQERLLRDSKLAAVRFRETYGETIENIIVDCLKDFKAYLSGDDWQLEESHSDVLLSWSISRKRSVFQRSASQTRELVLEIHAMAVYGRISKIWVYYYPEFCDNGIHDRTNRLCISLNQRIDGIRVIGEIIGREEIIIPGRPFIVR
jgi:hypothetical protein